MQDHGQVGPNWIGNVLELDLHYPTWWPKYDAVEVLRAALAIVVNDAKFEKVPFEEPNGMGSPHVVQPQKKVESHGGRCEHGNARRRQGYDFPWMPSYPFEAAFHPTCEPRFDRFMPLPAFQVLGQCFGGGIAPGRNFLQALEANDLEIGWGRRKGKLLRRENRCFLGAAANARKGIRLGFQNPTEKLEDGIGRERTASGEEFVEDDAETPDIAGDGQLTLTGDAFGGQILGRAGQDRGAGEAAFPVLKAGEAEVGNVGLPLRVEEQVGGLQVAVQDSMLVRAMDGPGDLGQQAGRGLGIGQEARPVLVQIAAGTQLHAVEMASVLFAHLVDGDDMGVVEAGDGFGFFAETGYVQFAGPFAVENHLEGDGASRTALVSLINHAHATPAEFAQDFIVAQATGRRGGRLAKSGLQGLGFGQVQQTGDAESHRGARGNQRAALGTMDGFGGHGLFFLGKRIFGGVLQGELVVRGHWSLASPPLPLGVRCLVLAAAKASLCEWTRRDANGRHG